MAEEKRRNPGEDIVTKLVNADIDGQSLDETEFGFFFILLTVAGNETTRNAISHGMNAFLDNPRPVGTVQEGTPGDRGRRDRPLGDPGQLLPADGQA